MKKPIIILLHTGFWFTYLFLIMAFLYAVLEGRAEFEAASADDTAEAFFMLMLFPAFLSFYTYYLFLFSRFLQRQQFLAAFSYGLLISVGAGLLGFLVLSTTLGNECVATGNRFPLGAYLIFSGITNTLCGTVAIVLQGFSTWFDEVQLKEELLRKNHAMELALIKSQLDPHFLFNTLNNIDILILKDPVVASGYLNRLSDIMRFMLYETKHAEISLRQEIEYIEKYLALQKIRTANEQYLSFEVAGQTEGRSIAPLIFIPFIENAIKHTVNKKLTDAIIIRLRISDSFLYFTCINKLVATPPRDNNATEGGLGNELIRKRLELIYPGQHTLSVRPGPEEYQVSLTINT